MPSDPGNYFRQKIQEDRRKSMRKLRQDWKLLDHRFPSSSVMRINRPGWAVKGSKDDLASVLLCHDMA